MIIDVSSFSALTMFVKLLGYGCVEILSLKLLTQPVVHDVNNGPITCWLLWPLPVVMTV